MHWLKRNLRLRKPRPEIWVLCDTQDGCWQKMRNLTGQKYEWWLPSYSNLYNQRWHTSLETGAVSNLDAHEMADVGDLVECILPSRRCERRNRLVPGYECINRKCTPCPIGSFGIDSKTCNLCPFGTSTTNTGETKCFSSFSFSTTGSQHVSIPYGVKQISVSLWGGGGGGGAENLLDDMRTSHAGGGGGFLSCNVSVPSSSTVYVVVGNWYDRIGKFLNTIIRITTPIS